MFLIISKNQVSWNSNFQNDGILYFAQRIVEMLDYKTIDIYRTPLLNTSCLIDEYLKTTMDSIKPFHQNQIYDEFLLSLKNDIVISNNWSHERKKQLIHKLNDSSCDRQSIMEYLQNTVGNHYLTWVKAFLLYIVPQGREKKKIESGLRCFIPELLRNGYNRDEIYHSANQILLNKDDPTQAFRDFLDNYNNEVKTYVVYFAVSNKLDFFKNILQSRVNINYVDDGNFHKIELRDNYCPICTRSIKAIDASHAANIAYKSIELYTSFYQFFGNYSDHLIQRNMLVISDTGLELRITVNRESFYAVKGENPPIIGISSEEIIASLVREARCALPQLSKIVRLHNRATANNGLENGFLNLWSILEVLCVFDQNSSKIEQVKDRIVPILKRDYLPAVFQDIAQNLENLLTEESLLHLLKGIDGDNNSIKVAKLILIPSYHEKLDTLETQLLTYPVLRSRILILKEQCKTKNSLFNISQQFAQRITWHLYRIYRARNAIIHTSDSPSYLKDLGEHLHSYVDNISREVIIKLSGGSLCQISNVYIDSELQQESWNEYFSTSETIDNETIKHLFSSQEVFWDN